MLASWCSTRPPFRQHNNEGGNERQEQHQLVGHDEAPSKEGGACRQAGSSRSFVANSAKDDQQARCINGAAGSWFLCRNPTGDAHEKAPPESVAKFVWEELAA